MRSDLTDITLVVDRSGSMQAVREDAQGGLNAFLEKQAGEPGEALLTLVQFDTDYEILHRGVPLAEAPSYQLEPRGATALLDAVGRAIDETGARLAAMPEAERPGLVVFAVVTDGEENSSQELTLEQVRERIEHQQEKYAWQFTFLGAGPDTFADAAKMGIHADGVAVFAQQKVAVTYDRLHDKVARMRHARREGRTVDNRFTAEEQKEMS